MKKIKSAAIKLKSGKIYTGKNHAEIMRKAHRIDEVLLSPERDKFGFVDTGNSFLTRYEAAIVAYKAGQIKVQQFELFSNMLKLEG
jgi:hypothetical protein